MNIKELSDLSFGKIANKEEILNLYSKYEKTLTRREFIKIAKQCLVIIKDNPEKYNLEDIIKEMEKLMEEKISYYLREKPTIIVKNVQAYISNNLSIPSLPRQSLNLFNMLQSYIEAESYYLTFEDWLKLLDYPVLKSILDGLFKCVSNQIKQNKLEQITTNKSMQNLILAYAHLHNFPLLLSIDATFFKQLNAKDNKLTNIEGQYNITHNELVILLNILKKYLNNENVLKILPQIIIRYQNEKFTSSIILVKTIIEECSSFLVKERIAHKAINNFNHRYQIAIDKLIFRLNRNPSLLEIAEEMEITLDDLKLYLKQNGRNTAKENQIVNANSLEEYIEIPHSILVKLIAKLPFSNQVVLQKVWGIDYNAYNAKFKWRTVTEESLYLMTIDKLKENYRNFLKKESSPVAALKIENILGLPLDFIKMAYEKLDENNKRVISYVFGPNLEEEYKKDKLTTATFVSDYEMALRKLRNLVDWVTIYEYLDIPANAIKKYLSKLTERELNVLYQRWDKNYLSYISLSKLKEDDEQILKSIYEKFKKAYALDKKIEVAHLQGTITIYEYFNTSKEILDPILEDLSLDKIRILKLKFGDDYCHYQRSLTWSNEDAKLFHSTYNIIKYKIKSSLVSSEITIYDYFKTSKEILDPILESLSLDRIRVLKLKFGEDYSHLKKNVSWHSKEDADLYHRTYVYIINRMNNVKVENNQTIYEYFNTSKEILKPILESLSEERQRVLKIKFGEDYCHYQKILTWSKENARLYHLTYCFLKYKINVSPIDVSLVNSEITIYDYFKTPKEKLDPILESLSLDRIRILKLKFGEDYSHYKKIVEWRSKEECHLFRITYSYIKKRLKAKTSNQIISIYDYFKTTKDVLDPVLASLTKEEKRVFQIKFGEDYSRCKKKTNWPFKQDKYLFNNTCNKIKKKIETRKTKEESEIISIYDFFETPKEILDPIIASLPLERQRVLKLKFGDDYSCKRHVCWPSQDDLKLYNTTYPSIRRKIEKIKKANALSNKPKITIYEYFKTTKEILDPFLASLPLDNIRVLKMKFGEDYSAYKQKLQWACKDDFKTYNTACKKISWYLKKWEKQKNLTNEIIKTIFDLKNSHLKVILEELSLKEVIVIFLLIAKEYSKEDVSNFTELSLEEINQIEEKYAHLSKDFFQSILENSVNKPSQLKRKID